MNYGAISLPHDLEQRYNALVFEAGLLPIKVSPFYLKKIEEEVAAVGAGGPLYRTSFPTEERLGAALESESRDYINENSHRPVAGAPYIIRKYIDRVAFIAADSCFGHCQYCFRSFNLSGAKKQCSTAPFSEKIDVLLAYLKSEENITEIIITGGDPLMVEKEQICFMLQKLSKWNLRIHTRAIIYSPQSISNYLTGLFAKHNVKIVFHINHPYEICRIVEKKIGFMLKRGLRLFAQYPLLRGINDSFLVQKIMLKKLTDLGVRPLSIFITEPNKYSAVFRPPFNRIEKIMDLIQWRTPSWINSVRFVLDTEIGKVRRENIVRRAENEIIFSRDGKEVSYPDTPPRFETETDEKKLLWKTPEIVSC